MSRRATVSVVPSAARLVTALRDVGYDFAGAVADLVDNSIAAGATIVDVTARFDGGDSWLRIADNGHGMDAASINEALRFGAERDYSVDDLGKFGLGLKTASLSQCRRITVASRTSPTRARIEARELNLDRMEKEDTWEIEILPAYERSEDLTGPLQGQVGTVVLWQQLDRVLPYRNQWGERARRGLFEHLERLEQHLGMVFQRFIDGEVPRRRKLRIIVNGNVVAAGDPFARGESATEALLEQDFDVAHAGVAGIVTFRPHVLPTKEEFSTTDQFDRLGRGQWNQSQGLWIYRANRLIQAGGWNRLRAADEHTKFARAALDFHPELDPAFGINIAKMRVNLPPGLRDSLRPPIETLVRRAKQRYGARPAGALRPGAGRRGPAPSDVAARDKPSPRSAGAITGGQATAGAAAPEPVGVPAVPARQALEAAAGVAGEGPALDRIITQLRDDDPEAARALGW